MRRIPFRWTLPALLLAAPLAGQATADQARLMFTLGFGQTSGGGTLWRVGNQPFIVGPGQVDTLAVDRSFRRSLNVLFSGTYFPRSSLGFNVEAQLLGLATRDGCTAVATTGAAETAQLCNSISRNEDNASAVSLSGGLVYRAWSSQPLHPYVRANAGFVVSQQSFLNMEGKLGDDSTGRSVLALYRDDHPVGVHPFVSFGGGIVAVIGRGYQFRTEIRDNWVRLPAVARASARQDLKPASTTVGKHFLSVTIGFDIVLERKRGRRY